MATESDLRDLLRDPDPRGRGAIDVDAVLSRARRRRRPKVLAAQALGSVAAVGVLVTGVAVTLPQATPASLLVAEDAVGGEELSGIAESSEMAEDARVGTLDACGEPTTSWPLLGWELDVVDTGAVDATAPVVRIALGNDGPQTTFGEVDVTSVSVIADGVVIGHGYPLDPQSIVANLDPDEGLSWEVPLDIVTCADPGAALAPGSYELRAVVQYTHTAGDGVPLAEPIVGTPRVVELR